MPSFTIGANTYDVPPNFATMSRLRDAGVDLLGQLDARVFTNLAADVQRIVDSLWAVTRHQAEQYGLTRDTWEQQLDSAAVENGTNALLEAITLFFPPAKRAILVKARSVMAEAETQLLRESQSRLDKLQASMPDLVKVALDQAASTSSGLSSSSPARSESTPPA
jgi:hypothetical protein